MGFPFANAKHFIGNRESKNIVIVLVQNTHSCKTLSHEKYTLEIFVIFHSCPKGVGFYRYNQLFSDLPARWNENKPTWRDFWPQQ